MLVALILNQAAIPKIRKSETNVSKGDLLRGYRRILKNRSALVCLGNMVLTESTWVLLMVYGLTYIRQSFSLSPAQASILVLGTTVCFTVGSLSGGRLVNKFGRKPIVMGSAFFLGLFTLIFYNLNVFWLSFLDLILLCIFGSARYTRARPNNLPPI